jgi:tetratricopeptide (TPR) repeat protein
VRLQKALEIFSKIGDTKHQLWCLDRLGSAHLRLGELSLAEADARQEIALSREVGNPEGVATGHWLLGQVRLCQGAWDEAIREVEEAIRLFQQAASPWNEGGAIYTLGRILVAQGERRAALTQYQEAVKRVDLEVLCRETRSLAVVLNSTESAYENEEDFRALCASWRESYPTLNESPLTQWYLEPAEILAPRGQVEFRDAFVDVLSPEWSWVDPMDDSWFKVQEGLEIHAANERGLWYINLGAPRVLRPTSGDLAIETACSPCGVPACGGLLIWKDSESYLLLDVGTGGQHEVFFSGCVENQDAVFGRGRLPRGAPRQAQDHPGQACGAPERVHLRLERTGERVRALCSLDGEAWFSVGETDFPAVDPLQVGVYANGDIDRIVHPGSYADGTAIRFRSFSQWSLGA